MSYKIKL
jgi:hypothetical protein